MKKILLIGLKDLRLAFRDRAALLLMLAAPFALTLGLGAVTGSFSRSSSGLSQIPVLIVNQDGGQLGQALVDGFQSPELAELVAPRLLSDPAEARRQVDADQAAAAVIVPAGFTNSILPAGSTAAPSQQSRPVQVQLYTNPTRPTSSGVIQAILVDFASQVEAKRAAAQVAVTQLVAAGLVPPAKAAEVGRAIGLRQAQGGSPPTISLRRLSARNEPAEFNLLAVLAPGMALMFLMFTTTNGGRSLLAERREGTLPRLLVTPTSSAQVLAGKVFGIYLTGTAQMLILTGATALLLGVRWGSLLGMAALILAAVAGAVGWGMLITALAKTPGQVGGIGSAVMLIFGILGGSFINLQGMPGWFTALSKITPNAWGIEGFVILASGGGLAGIVRPIVALLGMGVLLFIAAVALINRRGFVQP